MELDEVIITKAIIDRHYEKLTTDPETDVAIVGGGHSGLVTGYSSNVLKIFRIDIQSVFGF